MPRVKTPTFSSLARDYDALRAETMDGVSRRIWDLDRTFTRFEDDLEFANRFSLSKIYSLKSRILQEAQFLFDEALTENTTGIAEYYPHAIRTAQFEMSKDNVESLEDFIDTELKIYNIISKPIGLSNLFRLARSRLDKISNLRTDSSEAAVPPPFPSFFAASASGQPARRQLFASAITTYEDLENKDVVRIEDDEDLSSACLQQ